jgi:hypothetical protein
MAIVDRNSLDHLPLVSAIYFLVSQSNGLLYIGRAAHLRSRWNSRPPILYSQDHPYDPFGYPTHHKLRPAIELGDVSLHWWAVAKDWLGVMETLLIQMHQPPWNDIRC